MNEYSRGALEALSWAVAVLDKKGSRDGSGDIRRAFQRLASGVALDFAGKLREVEEL